MFQSQLLKNYFRTDTFTALTLVTFTEDLFFWNVDIFLFKIVNIFKLEIANLKDIEKRW